MLPLAVARVVVAIVDGYALAGVVFAFLFLPRALVGLDPRTASASWSLRLLILPGIAALWPLFAWRWMTSAPEPLERNPHRDRARATSTTP